MKCCLFKTRRMISSSNILLLWLEGLKYYLNQSKLVLNDTYSFFFFFTAIGLRQTTTYIFKSQ